MAERQEPKTGDEMVQMRRSRNRALLAAIDRLTSPAQMGEVFKAALLLPPGTGIPPGFESDEA